MTKKEKIGFRSIDHGWDPAHHPSSVSKLLEKWKKERGYHWDKNPKARFYANGKYATGVYNEKT